MRLTLPRLVSTIAGLCFSASCLAGGGLFSNAYFFGDSLSDSGNNRLAFFGVTGPNPTGPTFIPTFPYAPGGTYSNGQVWVTPFVAGLGLPAAAGNPSLGGGNNYAYGGATTSGSAAFPPSLQSQLNSYLASNTVDPNALYVIAGGGNDARAVGTAIAGGADPVSTTIAGATTYATTTASMVASLRTAGANNIIVWNVPNLGLTPAAGSGVGPAAEAGTAIAATFNSFLAGALAGSGVTIFDTFTRISQFVAAPAAFGFSNVTDACGFAGNNCDPATALFWDGIHPTAYAQSVIASQMLAVAVPEPASMLLLAFGVLALLGWRARRAG